MTQPQQLIEEDPCPRPCSWPGCSGSAASTGRATMRSDRCSDSGADRCSECLNRGIGSHGYCPRSDWSADRTRCYGWELDPDVRAPAPERCSLCRAVATVHLPPELGASALCRACADRVRAALEPPAEAEQKQLDAIYNLGLRGSRVPRCTCPDCCR